MLGGINDQPGNPRRRRPPLGVRKMRNVDKWIENVSQTCMQIFEAENWKVESQNLSIRSIEIRVSISLSEAVRELDRTASTVGRAVDCLRFS